MSSGEWVLHLHVSLRACCLCCHTQLRPKTQRDWSWSRALNAILTLSEWEPHMKDARGYLVFMVKMCDLLSMTATYCTTAIPQQLSHPLNTYKQRRSIYDITFWHTLSPEFFENGITEELQCENMSSVSEMSFIFKCQAVPVLHTNPLFPIWKMSRTGISYF